MIKPMLKRDYWESVFTDRPAVLLRRDHLIQSLVNVSIQNFLLLKIKQLSIKIQLGLWIKTGSWVIMGVNVIFVLRWKIFILLKNLLKQCFDGLLRQSSPCRMEFITLSCYFESCCILPLSDYWQKPVKLPINRAAFEKTANLKYKNVLFSQRCD